MKRLFLTSSIGTPGVAASIRARLGQVNPEIAKGPLKTAFITTPIEVEDMTDDEWYQADRAALKSAGFNFFDYTITGKTEADIHTDLSAIDAVYISGGNTNHLLDQSQKSGFVKFVQEFVNSGKLYVSTSAGSIIAGPTIPPYLWGDEVGAPNLQDYTGYNLVNFTVIPHWGSRFFREAYLLGRMEQIYQDYVQPFILLTDHQYVEVRDYQSRIVDVTKE